ncbi:heterokaryon incompatibility protein-domain-containing protein [Cladorrhinum sp. PSN259]|nr:heterokaryon incompatibility protein-domain-containing protein [Cladorrhinum sp. PSN259]
MARWHEQSCPRPCIVVEEDGNPRCDSCNRKCRWQDLEHIRSQSSTNAPDPIPADEPLGQLGLWWPPSVPYSKQLTYLFDEKPFSYAQRPPSPSQEHRLPTAIYPVALAPHEFRLASLTAADYPNFPLHLTLETYPQSACPDYETVSYTWGGENADNTPSRPIFVGPYWDVMFQTRNCWDMLRFVRPRRGVRLIWVDAICINQNDAVERANQVAKMRQIYRDSIRVVVYLGPDIAIPHPPGQFAARQRLDDLAVSSGEGQAALQSLLERRYFKRIWVIQELILPPQALIPVHGIDYWMDSMVYARLRSVPDWDWDVTAAPWVQHTAQGGIWGGDLARVLHMTAQSRSSDRRDQLFGVLSLANQDEEYHRSLQANYGLSVQHVFIGLFAHIISSLRWLDILYNATRYPIPLRPNLTWMPPWHLSGVWNTAFEAPAPLDLDLAEHIVRGGREEYHFCCFINFNRSWAGDEFPGASVAFARWIKKVSDYKPWHTRMAIHPATGALSIVATHFCPIRYRPRAVGLLTPWTIFEMHGSESKGYLYLVSRDPLDSICDPERDHIFILTPDDGSQLLYLILRLDSMSQWRLVSACRAMFLAAEYEPLEHRNPIQPGFESRHSLLKRVLPWLEKDPSQMKLPPYDQCARSLSDILPGIKTGWDAFPIYRAWLRKRETAKDVIVVDSIARARRQAFFAAYIACMDPRFEPQISEDTYAVRFRIPQPRSPLFDNPEEGWFDQPEISPEGAGSEQASRLSSSNSLKRTKSTWQNLKRAMGKPREDKVPDNNTTLVVVSDTKLRQTIAAHFSQVEYARRILRLDINALESLLREGLNDQQVFIGALYFAGRMDDFDIDGNTLRVTIL